MGYSLEQLKALGIEPAEGQYEETKLKTPGRKQGKPEDDFQTTVLKMAKLYGWKIAHFRRAMTKAGRWVTPVAADGKGFPDLLMIHEARKLLIVVELKHKTAPSPEQKQWLRLFVIMGIPTYLWRPRHWDEIQEVLTGERVCTPVEPKFLSNAPKRKSKRRSVVTGRLSLRADGTLGKAGHMSDSMSPNER